MRPAAQDLRTLSLSFHYAGDVRRLKPVHLLWQGFNLAGHDHEGREVILRPLRSFRQHRSGVWIPDGDPEWVLS